MLLVGEGVFYQLDPLADLVWRAADGRRSMTEVAEFCSATTGLGIGHALAGALIIIRYFMREGLMTLDL